MGAVSKREGLTANAPIPDRRGCAARFRAAVGWLGLALPHNPVMEDGRPPDDDCRLDALFDVAAVARCGRVQMPHVLAGDGALRLRRWLALAAP